jgi:Superinfection immunity protein/Short C-terminal domain
MYHHTFFPFFPGILGWTTLVILIVPYFLPTIIAFARKKDSAGGVFALNFFLGWTLIGWVACLIWALSDSRTTVIVNNNGPAYPPATGPAFQPTTHQTNPTWRPSNPKTTSSQEKIDQLRQLKQLFDEGALTEEEFNRQKASILG